MSGCVEMCLGEMCAGFTFLKPLEVDCLSELDQCIDYHSAKKRFSWRGTSADLEKFIEDRLIGGDAEENVPELSPPRKLSVQVLEHYS